MPPRALGAAVLAAGQAEEELGEAPDASLRTRARPRIPRPPSSASESPRRLRALTRSPVAPTFRCQPRLGALAHRRRLRFDRGARLGARPRERVRSDRDSDRPGSLPSLASGRSVRVSAYPGSTQSRVREPVLRYL